jgi:hypothetical protein
MKPTLDCLSCYLRIGLQAARIAGADEAQQRQMMAEFIDVLRRNLDGDSALGVAKQMQDIVTRYTGKTDPYLSAKESCTAMAEKHYAELAEALASSEDKLLTALKIAAIGNIMDYGAFSHFDLPGLVKKMNKQSLALNVREKFEAALKTAKTLSYITDNAGEIVFDQLLIQYLCENTDLEEIRLTIRKGAFLNDVSEVSDVPELLRKLPKVKIQQLSILEEEHDSDVWERIQQSDIILCKGMANFEKYSAQTNFYYLLISKCDLVSGHLTERSGKNISTGDWIFAHSDILKPEVE